MARCVCAGRASLARRLASHERSAETRRLHRRPARAEDHRRRPRPLLPDTTTRDSDGELIATPAEWDEAEGGEAPRIRIHIPRHARPGTTAGVGDRALLRIEHVSGDDVGYRGRIIKVIDHAKTRVLGVFRKLPDGGGRLVPVDKKQAGKELHIARTDTGGAQDGDLVSVDLQRGRGFGLASGKVKE